MNKITWALGVLVAFGLSSNLRAWADDGSTDSDVITQYNQMYQANMNAQIAAAKGDSTGAEQAWENLQKAEKNLRSQQVKDAKELQKLQDKEQSLETKQSKTESKIGDLSASGKSTTKEQTELTKIEAEIKEQNSAIAQARAAATTIQNNISQGQTALDADKTKKDALLQKYEQVATRPDNVRTTAATQAANDITTTQLRNGMTANFLAANPNTDLANNRIDKFEANALSTSINNISPTALNPTITGHIMNDQISKAIAATCTPDFQTACQNTNAAARAQGIAQVMQKALSAPGIGAVISSTNTTGQLPPSGGVNAPAGPPNAVPANAPAGK